MSKEVEGELVCRVDNLLLKVSKSGFLIGAVIVFLV